MEAEGYPYYFEKLTGEEETTVRAHFLTNSTSRDLGRYFPNSQLEISSDSLVLCVQ